MKRALFSLSDKSDLENFATRLAQSGWQLIASGGTAQTIRQLGLTVQDVSSITSFPEILGGRVKTLHPVIHGGILARDSKEDNLELKEHNIELIDLVVCNLYPFHQTVSRKGVTLEEAIEQIDIGGVTLLRAAAKNFHRATVVCDPTDYQWVLNSLVQNSLSIENRKKLAQKAFEHTQNYDTAIVKYLKELS